MAGTGRKQTVSFLAEGANSSLLFINGAASAFEAAFDYTNELRACLSERFQAVTSQITATSGEASSCRATEELGNADFLESGAPSRGNRNFRSSATD